MSFLDWLVLALFILSILLVALRKVSQSESSYLVADRKAGFFALVATLVMSEFNTATLVAFSSLGYLAGYKALVLPFIFLFGLLFYAVSVAKKWKVFNGFSVASFFTVRYGRDIGKLACIILLTSTACFSAAYLKSLVVIFNPLFPNFSEWTLSGIFVLAMLPLCLRGGLLSVISTDIFTFILTFAFFPIMAFFSSKGTTFLQSTSSVSIPFTYVLSLIILTMFTYILAPWYGQKIFAAKNEQVAFLSMIFSAFVIFVLYGFAVFSAACLKSSGIFLTNPEQALPYIVNHLLPHGLRGLGYGIFFAASATTLIGVWSSMASMIVGDFFHAIALPKSTRSVFITLCLAGLSYILCNVFIDQIFNKIILANIPIAALSFALIAGFYWDKASQVGAYCSIIVGLLCGTFSYLYFGEEGHYTIYWSMVGIPLIFLSGILGSIIKNPFKLKKLID